MLEASHQERFALEPLAKLGVGGNLLVHHLHDDLSAQVNLAGEIDPSHAALAEQPCDFVSPQKYAANHGIFAPRSLLPI